MIYSVELFSVRLVQTEEQYNSNNLGTRIIDLGDPFLVDGSVSIDTFTRDIGPKEAERLAEEYALKVQIEKREVESWYFCGFKPTEHTEIPTERKSDVCRE